MKTCKTCYTPKELTEFYKDKLMSDGYYSECKSCVINRVNVRRNNREGFFDVDKEMKYLFDAYPRVRNR